MHTVVQLKICILAEQEDLILGSFTYGSPSTPHNSKIQYFNYYNENRQRRNLKKKKKKQLTEHGIFFP